MHEIPQEIQAIGSLCRGSAVVAGRRTILLDPVRVMAAAQGDAPPITIEFQKTDKRNGYV